MLSSHKCPYCGHMWECCESNEDAPCMACWYTNIGSCRSDWAAYLILAKKVNYPQQHINWLAFFQGRKLVNTSEFDGDYEVL